MLPTRPLDAEARDARRLRPEESTLPLRLLLALPRELPLPELCPLLRELMLADLARRAIAKGAGSGCIVGAGLGDWASAAAFRKDGRRAPLVRAAKFTSPVALEVPDRMPFLLPTGALISM